MAGTRLSRTAVALCLLVPCALGFMTPARVGLTSQRGASARLSARPTLRPVVAPALRMAAKTEPEKFEFQAEVTRVMDIIINSLYSEKDVFLRELVSNAADACDKKRFLTLGKESDELQITIKPDAVNKKVIIEDTGVGMSKEELINNLGRIAQSGTKGFAEAMKAQNAAKAKGETEDINLIGQFGVGFYSGFLVADKMTVITKGLQGDGKTYQWESEAGQSFEIAEVDEGEIEGESGTKIVLHLREDAEEYLDDFKLKNLVQRYSEFINFPIKIWTQKTTYEQVDDEEANKDLKEGETRKKKSVPVTTSEWETQNTQKPLWMRPPSKVTDEQYDEFYKSTFKAFDKPLTKTHFSLEGQVEFKALLFVPSQLPWELTSNMFDENAKNMRLYVKRVFINDNFQELCPRWLKFVRGVIDSEDLPLNVGREILQKSSVLRVVSRRVVKKSLDMIDGLKEKGGEDWINFQKNFGKYLKVGVVEDNENRQDIAKLCTFRTNQLPASNFSTLDEYVGRMKEGQECVYFVSGEGRAQCEISPALDKVKDNGYEVIFCTEPLDELCMMEVKKYDKFEIVDLTKSDAKGIDDATDKKKEKEDKQIEFDVVTKFLADTLGKEKVAKAEISLALSDSPACLAQGEYGMSPQMQKYMKARAVQMGDMDEEASVGQFSAPCVLQVNPSHPILEQLKSSLQANEGKGTEQDEKRARLLYHVAALRGGYEITDTKEFASLVTEIMSK